MKYFYFSAFLLLLYTCRSDQPNRRIYDLQSANIQRASLIHQLNHELIKVISEDLFSPPVASRIYAYSNIAAYEAARQLDPHLPSLAGKLNDLSPLPEASSKNLYWEIAMISGFCEVAKHLVYRDLMIDTIYQQIMDSLQMQYPDATRYQQSVERGQQIARHIKAWADKDGYNATRNMPRYEPLKGESSWEATQPTYGEALEPHWFKLRPFVMDSTSQFRADAPMKFSKDKDSDFYAAAMEIYEMVNNSKQEDIDIAVYWDCNPGPTLVEGHVMQVRKQNTPGGHWVGIHSIVAKKKKQSLAASCAVYARLCSGMADGFMAAWDTKFHYHLLRPETYVNRYFDPNWKPKLESPLFPEYTSAHSLVSAVAASILDNAYSATSFFDDTNTRFGLPPKRFNDFWQAAEEAARSRLLGGIHYTFGCDVGFAQGKALGDLVNERLRLTIANGK